MSVSGESCTKPLTDLFICFWVTRRVRVINVRKNVRVAGVETNNIVIYVSHFDLELLHDPMMNDENSMQKYKLSYKKRKIKAKIMESLHKFV